MDTKKTFTPQPVEKYPFEARKKILDAIRESGNDYEALQDIIDPIEQTYPGIQNYVLKNCISF